MPQTLRRDGGHTVLSCVLLILLAGAGRLSAAAVEIEPGRVYSGGTRLGVAEYGVAFTVPEGWRGALPHGAEVFQLQPEDGSDALILAMADAGTRDELEHTMGEPIPLGNGAVLRAAGGAQERGRALARRYEMAGAGPAYAAYGEGLAGANGIAVAYVLIAVPDAIGRWEPALRAMTDSTDLGSVAPPTQQGADGAGDGAEGAASGAGDRWDVYLRGKHIVRLYTGSGYSEEEHIWLCSDGSFRRRGSGGGFGGGASGAFQSDSTGRWTATGAGERGKLVLHYRDGSSGSYQLRWDYAENHLYVDDRRWFHDENRVCN